MRTRKNHAQKFRHIGYNVDLYKQSFFPNSISVWNGLAKNIAEANTLDIFSLNYKIRLHRQSINKHIRKRILLINEPEPHKQHGNAGALSRLPARPDLSIDGEEGYNYANTVCPIKTINYKLYL